MSECHSPKPVSGRAEASTHHSSSLGMVLRGGQRQYVWKAMSHSSQRSCLSGSCLPPHRWQAHTRQVLLWSSLQCLQEGPLFPGHGSQGQLGQGWSQKGTGAPAPHPTWETWKGKIRTHFSSGFQPWGCPRLGAQSWRLRLQRWSDSRWENYPCERQAIRTFHLASPTEVPQTEHSQSIWTPLVLILSNKKLLWASCIHLATLLANSSPSKSDIRRKKTAYKTVSVHDTLRISSNLWADKPHDEKTIKVKSDQFAYVKIQKLI